MKTSLLFSSLLFSSLLFSKTDWCSEQQRVACQNKEIKIKNICFVKAPEKASIGNREMTDRIQDVAECNGFDRYDISSAESIRNIIKDLSGQCIEVGELKMSGHGNSHAFSVGNMRIWEFDKIFKLENSQSPSCIMKQSATIKYLGCNTGNGCAGRAGMYALAKLLLAKGGNVIAPSNYYLDGSINSSVNGFDQQLDYWNETEKWTLQGVWDIKIPNIG